MVELRDGRAFALRDARRYGPGRVCVVVRGGVEGNVSARRQIQSVETGLFSTEQGGEDVEPLRVADGEGERPRDEALGDAALAAVEEEAEEVAEREGEEEHYGFEPEAEGVQVEERVVPDGHDGVGDDGRQAQQQPWPTQVRLERVRHQRPSVARRGSKASLTPPPRGTISAKLNLKRRHRLRHRPLRP